MAAVDLIWQDHIERLKTAILEAHTTGSVPEWIQNHTHLRGKNFSFKDHEYQLRILRDPSRERVIRKCSQIGISEMSFRYALAMCCIVDGYTCIYTLPTAKFAASVTKTRINPIIESSRQLSAALHPHNDNADLKQFNSSFLYLRGTVGSQTAISVPADCLVHDELDFSDQDVVTSYTSRLTHSPFKHKVKLSTPTVDKFGISYEFMNSRRHWNMVKCHRCSHTFLPDYFQHVKIPGYDDSLRMLTKERLQQIRWKEAKLLCPHCGQEPSLQVQHREWVVENPDSAFDAAGYQIQPFDAPNVIAIPDLVQTSGQYRRYADFVNFSLGLPEEDSEMTLTRGEINELFVSARPSLHQGVVMGVDMGLTCHIMLGTEDNAGRLFVVHAERVPIGGLSARLAELHKEYLVLTTVMDVQPYVETVLRLQEQDPNLWGALYVTRKSMEPFVIKEKEEDTDRRNMLDVRELSVNRNKALDVLMDQIRRGKIFFLDMPLRTVIVDHLTDMKRINRYTNDNDTETVWQKSTQGQDHFHHALLYLWLAWQMRGLSRSRFVLPSMLSSFKVKGPS